MKQPMHALKNVMGWSFPEADAFMANELQADGTYQASHLSAALAYVADWSIACDAGSHVGTWAKILSTKFQRVIAVEPAGDTYESLALNMAQFGCRNVELVNAALGAEPGFVDLVLDERGVALKNTGARYVQPGDSIQQVTIDSWQLPSLGFLKMDVEGSEVDVLKGAAQTVRRCHPVVLFESKGFWCRYGYAKDAPHTFLRSLGYRFVVKVGCDEIWQVAQ